MHQFPLIARLLLILMSVELYSLHCLPISRLIIVNLSPIYDHLALRNSWQQQSSSLTHGLCYNSGNAFGADFWGAVCTLMTSRCLFVIYYSVNCISSLRTFSFTAEVSATAEPLHKILSFFFSRLPYSLLSNFLTVYKLSRNVHSCECSLLVLSKK